MQCGHHAYVCPSFSKTHCALSPLTSVKQSKTTGPCSHCVPISEGRRKTVKRRCYSYMIVCIKTSCARLYPLCCVWTPPKYSTVRARGLAPAVGDRKWLLSGGAARSIRAPSAAAVGRVFRWMLRQTELQEAADGQTLAAAQNKPLVPSGGQTFTPLQVPGVHVHPNPLCLSRDPHSSPTGCWLAQAGIPLVCWSPHRPVPVQTTVTDVGHPVFLYKCILTVTLWMM